MLYQTINKVEAISAWAQTSPVLCFSKFDIHRLRCNFLTVHLVQTIEQKRQKCCSFMWYWLISSPLV